MSTEVTISRSEAIKQVLARLEGAITVDEFVKRVLAIWPSKAKNPASGIRQTLRYDEVGKTLLFLTGETIAPINIALKGVCFRISLSRQEVKQGFLLVYPHFTYFLPYGIPAEKVELLDANGHPIPTKIVTFKQTQKTIFGSHTSEQIAFDLGKWYQDHRVERDDSLIVAIEDWEAGQFRLAHEPARDRKRHQADIDRRNQELANLLFEMLETDRSEDIFGSQAILTAYVRLPDPTGYPGDHWLDVLERDERMQWTGSSIRYADSPTFLDRLITGPAAPRVQKAAFSSEQGRQVYQFKAALRHNEGLWRRIEIQGHQTLVDFDSELRTTFQHDLSDHLSGFWKLVRRGQSRRFREVDLGNIEPFGGGEATDLSIAGLGLTPGDQLKYVYDFGDWIEHRITLEAITEPQKGIKYPRVIEQNKPRYRYCHHCRAQGRKTVATWICIECSDREQEAVLICEDCLDREHPEHFAEEILY